MSGGIVLNKKLQWAITFILPLLVYMIPTSETGFTVAMKLFFVCTLFPILLAAFELVPMVVYALISSHQFFLQCLLLQHL